MIDPLCIICTPGLCVHGEQSPTSDEVEISELRRQLQQAELERDAYAAIVSLLLEATKKLATGTLSGAAKALAAKSLLQKLRGGA